MKYTETHPEAQPTDHPFDFDGAPFAKVAPDAQLARAYQGDAGFDVAAMEDVVVRPGQVTKVGTGVRLCGNGRWACLVQERSSQALKGLQTIGNVVDGGYKGEIHAVFVNHGKSPVVIRKGEKLCQLVPFARWVLASEQHLPERGAGAFGSSGRKITEW